MFDSIEALEQHIINVAEDAMKADLHKEVVKIQQEEIESTVYNVYEPVQYERRKAAGGLQDPKNMHSKTIRTGGKGFLYNFYNDTTGNQDSRYIGEIVEKGQDATGGYNYVREGASYLNPRPFMQNTLRRIADSKVHEHIIKNKFR